MFCRNPNVRITLLNKGWWYDLGLYNKEKPQIFVALAEQNTT